MEMTEAERGELPDKSGVKLKYNTLTEQHEGLQAEYATLSEQYEQLHRKSGEIIATLQEERDVKIAECENLRSQIQALQLPQDYLKRGSYVENTEGSQSEIEFVRGEYNRLVCSYTSLKLEYESNLTCHCHEIQDLKKEHEIEMSLLLEKLKIAQGDNDTVYNVQLIRRLQKTNSEFEQKVYNVRHEMEAGQSEFRAELSRKDQVILKQSASLKTAEAEVESLQAKCSALSETLVTTQQELSQCLEKHRNLNTAVESAQRDTAHTQMELEELKAVHKSDLSQMEIRLTQEYLKIKESSDHIQREKRVLEEQIHLLGGTIKEYEALMVNKELELRDQLKSLRQSEWEKRVPLEREVTFLLEKFTSLERSNGVAKQESEVQIADLQNHVKELSRKCGWARFATGVMHWADRQNYSSSPSLPTSTLSLESEIISLNVEKEHQIESKRTMEKELHNLKDHERECQNLQSQNRSLVEAKQKLESNCTKFRSTVCGLEMAISEAKKDVNELRAAQQQALDDERLRWQDENESLLQKLNDKEMQVKRLLSSIDDEKKNSKKVKGYYKTKTIQLKDALELAKAKQMEVEAEKESIRKSLSLDQVRLKNTISKLKQKEKEFSILLQGDYCCSGGELQEHRVSFSTEK